MSVVMIISGGQTGADRGGLEAAAALSLRRGGWAPKGWRAEDGAIPEWYREGMIESDSNWYQPRTELNVKDSDGTLILSFGDILFDSGSHLTSRLCRKHDRPCRHFRIDHSLTYAMTIRICGEWIAQHGILTLNVAGPRESREPGIQAATKRFLVDVLGPDAH